MDANDNTGGAPQQSADPISNVPAPGSPKRVIAMMVLLVLVIGGFWAYQIIYTRLSIFEVEGTITQIDADNRLATLEFESPRDGTKREEECEVPESCELIIDGKPADVEDFRVGDRATVKARWDKKNKKIVPMIVRVDRSGGDSSS